MRAGRLSLLGALVLIAALVVAPGAYAQTAEPAEPQSQKWSFDGVFGTFDRASAQRGFLVYQQVCSSCHSMKLMYYRNLAGIGLTDQMIKDVAASVQVPGGLNDEGQPFERPGLPSDHFKSPFPNDLAARAANGGALPPDQSVLENARENGANYIYALLTGYSDPPPGMKMGTGMYYNKYFPGNQIGMPQPLTADRVTYTDGTKATLDQEAHDVVTFLAYAANPNLDERHAMGVRVILFLGFLTCLTYGVKRKIWSSVH
jgi:ubiquinol-cytochrome c reductase cytochrome c1 subunit